MSLEEPHVEQQTALEPEAQAAPESKPERVGTKTETATSGMKKGKVEIDGKELSQLWANIGEGKMEEVLYGGHLTYMNEVQQRQDEYLRQLIATESKRHKGNLAIVDVGCSTGNDIARMVKGTTIQKLGLKSCTGIDIAEDMIARANIRELGTGVDFVAGDATHLLQALNRRPDEPPTIVTNLGNTLGIVYGEVRDGIIENMCQLAGEKGTLVITCWNAEPYGSYPGFRFALDTFYQDVRPLTGLVQEKDWHPDLCEIRRDNGYYSHWWHESEIRMLLATQGMDIVRCDRLHHCLYITAQKAQFRQPRTILPLPLKHSDNAKEAIALRSIGLIGGVSWVSTATYYKVINEHVQKRLGGMASAKVLMYSFNFDDILPLQKALDRKAEAALMVRAALSLQQQGANCIVICSNTTHASVPYFQPKLKIPVIHIAETTAAHLVKERKRKVLFLGTKYTMTPNSHVVKPLTIKGIEVVLPEEKVADEVHRMIYDELCHGVVNPKSKSFMLATVKKAKKDHKIEAVVLGCTELPLILTPEDEDTVGVDIVNTTTIHALAAVEYSLKTP